MTGLAPMNFSYKFGKHSIMIYQLCAAGTLLDKVVINVRKFIGGTTAPAVYLTYTLGLAMFSNQYIYSSSSGEEDNTPNESMTIVYQSVQLEYSEQKYGDNSLSGTITAAWDVGGGKAQLADKTTSAVPTSAKTGQTL